MSLSMKMHTTSQPTDSVLAAKLQKTVQSRRVVYIKNRIFAHHYIILHLYEKNRNKFFMCHLVLVPSRVACADWK